MHRWNQPNQPHKLLKRSGSRFPDPSLPPHANSLSLKTLQTMRAEAATQARSGTLCSRGNGARHQTADLVVAVQAAARRLREPETMRFDGTIFGYVFKKMPDIGAYARERGTGLVVTSGHGDLLISAPKQGVHPVVPY